MDPTSPSPSPLSSRKRLGENLYATPARRARTTGSVASNIKEHLLVVLCPASGHRCLITSNTEPKRALQVAHVLDRSTKLPIIKCLENAWGVGKLHLDSRYNLFHYITLHVLFDSFYWTLVPDLALLTKVRNSYEYAQDFNANLVPGMTSYTIKYREFEPIRKLDDPDYGWRYHFVPLPTITQSNHRIFRAAISQATEPSSTEVLDVNGQAIQHAISGEGTLYRSPYSSFPVLRSHVHPFFVICKAYYAFRSHFQNSHPPQHLSQHWELLKSIYEEYWVPPPNRSQKTVQPSYDDKNDHIDPEAPDCPSEDGSLDEPGGDATKREPPIPEEDERGEANTDRALEESGGVTSLAHTDDVPDFEHCSSQDSTSEVEMEDLFTIHYPTWLVDIPTGEGDLLELEWSNDVKETEVKLTQERLHEDVVREIYNIFNKRSTS